ncbi:uncharacterized protein CC84DRAFT_1168773 [Paraphaeosphaeria sporulosa]|uniref:Secreted protein n=1 Tax=Paraphaeosphaeria sporulosa TaxID=1460663 RepID=A0A177C001_9PLEO|nr:uncharacterized protein CC84DRAFT_1168773 [Paraphaeosphaeria sporulosa]OAG00736.1 hypothetical protein CC84DRAFT_1168773 [Paraphaeosphaeria sporulosa]
MHGILVAFCLLLQLPSPLISCFGGSSNIILSPLLNQFFTHGRLWSGQLQPYLLPPPLHLIITTDFLMLHQQNHW